MQSKENIKAPRLWPLWGEFTGDRWFPRTRASNAENVSIWWRHHGFRACVCIPSLSRRLGPKRDPEWMLIRNNTTPVLCCKILIPIQNYTIVKQCRPFRVKQPHNQLILSGNSGSFTLRIEYISETPICCALTSIFADKNNITFPQSEVKKRWLFTQNNINGIMKVPSLMIATPNSRAYLHIS